MNKLTKPLYDSVAERYSYEILKELINVEQYDIILHVNLKDIFAADAETVWKHYQIDFLIIDKYGYPVMGIEINGKAHYNMHNCKEHDQIKKRCFVEHSIPLVSIPLVELPTYDAEEFSLKYKKALRVLFVNNLLPYQYRSFYPAYCRMCGEQYAYKYKNDFSGSFYCCANSGCQNCSNNITVSATDVPELFSDTFKNIVKIMQKAADEIE